MLAVVALALAQLAPPAAAHDQTAVVKVSRLMNQAPAVEAPSGWQCAVAFNVYHTRDVLVWCLPPERGAGECLDKSVDLRATGADIRMEAVTWCTAGGLDARCSVAWSLAVNGGCSKSSGPAGVPIWDNEIGCAVVYAGSTSLWEVTCRITVSHA